LHLSKARAVPPSGLAPRLRNSRHKRKTLFDENELENGLDEDFGDGVNGLSEQSTTAHDAEGETSGQANRFHFQKAFPKKFVFFETKKGGFLFSGSAVVTKQPKINGSPAAG
jgi:hypothetical protein